MAYIYVTAFVGVDALLTQQVGHPLALLTVAVDVVVSAVLCGSGDQLSHSLVDALGSERTAEGQDHWAAAVEPQTRLCFSVLYGEYLGSDGVACKDESRLIGEAAACVVVSEHHAVNLTGEHFICDAGIGVLLMDNGFTAEVAGGKDDGAADIAAGTYADIGLEIFDDLLSLASG